jgi:disulfide oxidoreductase YuzD
VPAYALSYSTLLRKKAQGKIQYNIDDVYYFNREEIKLISLETFNKLGNFNFKNIYELIFNAPTIDEEFSIRNSINSSAYDLSPIIIVEQIIDSKLNIYLDSKIYEDIREKLIIF